MPIGKKIHELRTAAGLSQEELAVRLEVSRQSVSKWETDAAVPELDKLLRISDMFGVTLDELAGRSSKYLSGPENENGSVKTSLPTMHQRIIGYILLAVSLIAGTVIAALTDNENELVIASMLLLPMCVCSLICLFVKQGAWYWCIWAVEFPLVLIGPSIVPLSSSISMTVIRLLISLVMILVANKVYHKRVIRITRKRTALILFLWMIWIGVGMWDMWMQYRFVYYNWILFLFVQTVEHASMALLLTATAVYIPKKDNGTSVK